MESSGGETGLGALRVRGLCFYSSGSRGGEREGRGEEGDGERREREKRVKTREKRDRRQNGEAEKEDKRKQRQRQRGRNSKTGRYGESETGKASRLVIILE